MISAVLAAGAFGGAALASELPPLLLWGGGLGFMVFAYIKGLVIPKGSHQEKCAESDGWKQLYLDERAAHARTREALVIASQRADSSVDTGRIVVDLVRALQGGHDHELAAPPSSRPRGGGSRARRPDA